MIRRGIGASVIKVIENIGIMILKSSGNGIEGINSSFFHILIPMSQFDKAYAFVFSMAKDLGKFSA